MKINHDLLLNTDIGDSINGHVSPSIKQVFETLTATPFSQKKLKLSGYEFLVRDQFGNHYFKMRAILFDGELYDVDQYIKPSMMIRTGGGYADLEDKTAKAHLSITEALLKELREQGAITLGRTNLEVMKARSLSQAPVAIETSDITHQANLLEDAIKAAKIRAGEWVDEVKIPEGFEPLKAELVKQPEANVIPFLPANQLLTNATAMNSSAANMHHNTKSPADKNGGHGMAASHSGKTGNKVHDAGMAQGPHGGASENLKGGKSGTPKSEAYSNKSGGHSHAEGA